MAKATPLFGGAMTATLPSNFVDASDLRQVPDNQEVFISRDGDDCFAIDILDLCTEASEEEAATYHFTDLADANESIEREVVSVRKLDTGSLLQQCPDASAYILQGLQKVSKFREHGPGAENVLLLSLVCVRIPSVATDLVLSYNRPVLIGPLSSSASLGRDVSSGMPGSGTVVDPGVLEAAEGTLRIVWESLRVLDWGLFGIEGSAAATTTR